MDDRHQKFKSFNWDSSQEWKNYIESVTIPDPSKQNEIVEKLKKRWYKKNIDPEWEEQTSGQAPILETFPVGPLSCNCSILVDPVTKDGVLVDPGGTPDTISQKLKAHNVKVKYILITHAHFDHFLAAEIFRKQTGAPVILHKDDLPLWAMKDIQCSLFGIPNTLGPVSDPDKLLDSDEELPVNENLKGKSLHTPGHSPGSTCFLFESSGILFSGDTLFKGSVGRTDLWGGDKNLLIKSIREKLTPLRDDIVVVPGHGPNTTIGAEKRSNPFLGANF